MVANALPLQIFAQNFPVEIARWKNNAKGAYSIIHDDFGDPSVDGIQNFADSMNANRGLKMTFGAITSTCEWRSINWKGTPRNMYYVAKEMIELHGHEIINHSHTHSCAINSSNCGGIGVNHAWSTTIPHKMDIEITQSTNSIKNNTGYTPRYYIYPYDQFSTISNNFLKNSGYIGSRTGAYNAAESPNFAPDNDGFFRNAFVVDVENQNGIVKAVRLNYWVDHAINNQTWVCRELHNVGNSGWGHVTVDEYRNHLNHVKQKVDLNDLWVGTISEILTYQIQKINFSPISSYDAVNKKITVNWNTPSFNVSNYLTNLQFKSPITLNINVSAVPTSYKVYQNGLEITDVKRKNNIISVNVYPHLGPVILQEQNCQTLCVIQHPTSTTVNAGHPRLVLRGKFVSNQNIDYQWFKNNLPLSNETRDSIVLTNIKPSDAGSYVLQAISGNVVINSNPAQVNVLYNSPFLGFRAVLPGKIEAEHFDEGPQGLAYNESTPFNQGNASWFRNTPVDIETCTDEGGGFNIGYITDGEWLTYSVTVQTTGFYDFSFRVASNSTNNKSITLYIDNQPVITNLSINYTGGWQNWQTINIFNVPLSSGEKEIKLYFSGGDFNINFFSASLRTLLVPKNIDNENLNLIATFPNPVKEFLSIENYSIDDIFIEMLDIKGSLIYCTKVQPNSNVELNVKNFRSGTYIIRFKTDKMTYSKLLIKE